MHVKGKENNYIKLFDAYVSKEEFDEKKIKKNLKNSPALNYFSSSQAYLYKLILKCLRAYHSDGFSSTKILEHLQDSICLKDKGLFEESNRMLERAEKLAEQEEDPFFLLKSYDLQQDNFFRNQDIKKLEYLEKQLQPGLDILTDKIKEKARVKQLQARAFHLYLRYGESSSDKGALPEVSEILNDPLLKTDRKYHTRDAFYRSQSAKTSLYFVLGDYHALMEINRHHLTALEKDPTFDSENMRFNYASMLNNRIAYCSRLGMSKELDVLFKKVLSLKFNTINNEVFVFGYTYVNVMAAYIEFEMIDKAMALIPEIIRKLKKYESTINEEGLLLLQSNIAIVYFMSGAYSDSLKWINKILNINNKETRQDILIDTRILNILVHYELKNYQLMSSLIISLQRHISKLKKQDDFSKIICNHMKKLEFVTDKKEIQAAFLSFRKDLKSIMTKGKDNQSYVLAWIEKKI